QEYLRASDRPPVNTSAGTDLSETDRSEIAASFDLQVLSDLRDIANGDFLDLVREVADNALNDVPPRLESLRSAVATGADPDVSRAAHALRSLSASIGAVRLAAMCHDLERLPSEAVTLLAPIECEWGRVRSWLQSDLSGWLL
ncbi:MAG: Hpt domain-containing protein, partial [Cyanobacteria bacterium J06648_11]